MASRRRKSEPPRLATVERSRRTNSYERNLEKLSDNHEYENLVKPKEKVPRCRDPLPELPKQQQQRRKPRSKRNETYESVALRPIEELTEENKNVKRRGRPGEVVTRVVLFLSFLIVMGELGFVTIIWRGYLAVPLTCKGECAGIGESPSVAHSRRPDWQGIRSVIEEMKSRAADLAVAVKELDDLTDSVKKSLDDRAKRIAKLEHASNSSMKQLRIEALERRQEVGPDGLRGFNGSQGPPGLRGPKGKPGYDNLVLCRYTKKDSSPFTADETGSGQSVDIQESNGIKIFGASCSTSGTTEYNLRGFQISRDLKAYECVCKGLSTLFPLYGAQTGKSVCSIHYWTCPTLS